MKFVATKTADTGPAGAAPGTGAPGQPAHRHYQSNSRLPAGARHCGAARTTVPARRVAAILATPPDVLSPRMVRISKTWPATGAGSTSRSEFVERDRNHRAPGCRLRTVDERARDGPIISSAMVAAIGAGDVFTKGRDFAAWLGLVPKRSHRRPHHSRFTC